jgi:hypothetical protein
VAACRYAYVVISFISEAKEKARVRQKKEARKKHNKHITEEKKKKIKIRNRMEEKLQRRKN